MLLCEAAVMQLFDVIMQCKFCFFQLKSIYAMEFVSLVECKSLENLSR